jgi:hypothetical protein
MRMTRIPSTWLALVLGALVVGCTSSSPSVGSEPSAHAIIGTEGGSVQLGGARVSIPPLALSQPIEIGIERVTSLPALPSGLTLAGPAFALTPHGTHFARPVQVTLPSSHGANVVLRLDDANDTSWQTFAHVAPDELLQAQVALDGFSIYVTGVEGDEFHLVEDAGIDAAQVTDAGIDASLADAGNDATAPTAACGAVTSEMLHVDGAGSGTLSGCAPRVCQGRARVPDDVDAFTALAEIGRAHV